MPNNLARLKYGAPPPAQCWGATATIQEDAPLDEDDTDAPPLALSNEAAQPVRDPQPESSIDAALGDAFTSQGRNSSKPWLNLRGRDLSILESGNAIFKEEPGIVNLVAVSPPASFRRAARA